MIDVAMQKSLQDLASLLMVLTVLGAVVIGWLNNRGRPKGDTSDSGFSSDDGPHHDGWWGGDDADGGHNSDNH